MMYVRFPLSLRNVEDRMRELGIDSRPNTFVTDKLRSYGAAMKEIGNVEKQETGRLLNNRAENSHPPFRRRERAMLGFRRMRTLQKSVAVHASVDNHFNVERHLYSRSNFKRNSAAALTEWRVFCAG
jgi:putative transposase